MNDLLKMNQNNQQKVLLPINPSQMHHNSSNIHHQNHTHSSSNTTQTITVKKTDRSINNTKRTLSSSISTDDPTATASGPKRVKNQNQHQRTEATNQDRRQATLLQSAPQTAPQLLQQLMAPTPQQQQQQLQRDRDRKVERNVSLEETIKNDASKWGTAGSNNGQATMPRQSATAQAASNSVLKNLLVSGCDISAGYVCVVPMRAKKALKT